MIKEFSIRITRYRKPNKNIDFNENLRLFSDELGLINDRDKEKSCFRVFFEIVKSTKENTMLSSDDIAENSNLSRATVIHHINKLIDSGLIITKRNRYMLKMPNLRDLIIDLQDEVNRTLEEIKNNAIELDEFLEKRIKKGPIILD